MTLSISAERPPTHRRLRRGAGSVRTNPPSTKLPPGYTVTKARGGSTMEGASRWLVNLCRTKPRRQDRPGIDMTAEFERAVQEGDATSVRRQLESGADVNARDRRGQTALMIAAERGHTGLVCELVAAGAALDHAAKYGLTALMRAVLNHHPEIVRLLVEAGADRSIRGSGTPGFAGKTAYDLAEAQGSAELAEMLRPAP